MLSCRKTHKGKKYVICIGQYGAHFVCGMLPDAGLPFCWMLLPPAGCRQMERKILPYSSEKSEPKHPSPGVCLRYNDSLYEEGLAPKHLPTTGPGPGATAPTAGVGARMGGGLKQKG